MEVDFTGKAFPLIDRLTGEITPIVVFVAVLPYSQYIYAEGMSSTKEIQWIEANNNALEAFGGVPAIVICNNCKQAVIANKGWIQQEHLPRNYRDFSEWNGTYFIRKASTVGPNTAELIKRVLRSRKLEVQTYRLCVDILGFTKKKQP